MIVVYVIMFFIIALTILFGSHYLFYFSTVRFFPIALAPYKKLFFGVVVFLALSFILAEFLSHGKDNGFTRAFFSFSASWLGLLLNLVLAIALAWLVIGIGRLAGLAVNKSVLGGLFYLLAFIYSAYGMWNAFHPRIKNLSIEIPGLPEQWKGKRIAQLSDVHLGPVHGQGFMRHVVGKVNSIHPDLVVITGDLFDGTDGDLTAFIEPLEEIQPGKGVFFITGNHETYLGVDKVFKALQKTEVRVLKDEVVDVDGLKLIGIDYPRRREGKDVVAVLRNLEKDFSGRPNILLYHSPVHADEFKNCGVNLQLSGHTHKGQLFPIQFISRQVYGKYYTGFHTDGNYSIYTTSGVGTWGPPLRTGNTPEIVVITLR